MVVDDAVVVRGLVARWIDDRARPADRRLAAQRPRSGRAGRAHRSRRRRARHRHARDRRASRRCRCCWRRSAIWSCIMASTLTRRNAEVSLQGAVARRRRLHPEAADQPRSHDLADVPPRADREDPPARRAPQAARSAGTARAPVVPAGAGAPRAAPSGRRRCAAPSRAPPRGRASRSSCGRSRRMPPRVLLIGSSTGGPQALDRARRPHRAGDRSRAGADHPAHAADLHDHPGRASRRARAAGRRTRRSTASRSVAGTIYVAPGGRHMRVARRDGAAGDRARRRRRRSTSASRRSIRCSPRRPRCGAAAILAVILTGMGIRRNARRRRYRGRRRQRDRAGRGTSVVWGMPGSAAHAGVCSAVLPLDQIAPKIVRLFGGDRP